MEHEPDTHPHEATHAAHAHGAGGSLNRLAFTATLHCLSGCAVGEVLVKTARAPPPLLSDVLMWVMVSTLPSRL